MSSIIALEGVDGCGKDTQVPLIAQYLNAKVYQFPSYNTPMGNLLRTHLDRKWKVVKTPPKGVKFPISIPVDEAHMDALAFQGLQFANRLEHLNEIQNDLLAGKPLVFNRWTESGIVYGKLDGLDEVYLERAQRGLPKPDVYVLLDLTGADAYARLAKDRNPDRYESDVQFMSKVALEYRRRWRYNRDDLKDESYVIVDASKSIADVQNEIRDAVDRRVR